MPIIIFCYFNFHHRLQKQLQQRCRPELQRRLTLLPQQQHEHHDDLFLRRHLESPQYLRFYQELALPIRLWFRRLLRLLRLILDLASFSFCLGQRSIISKSNCPCSTWCWPVFPCRREELLHFPLESPLLKRGNCCSCFCLLLLLRRLSLLRIWFYFLSRYRTLWPGPSILIWGFGGTLHMLYFQNRFVQSYSCNGTNVAPNIGSERSRHLNWTFPGSHRISCREWRD